MKRILTLGFAVLSACFALKGQNTTSVGSLNIQKEVKPAILNIVDNSVKFLDRSGNNAIDANEECTIQFKVTNTGMGDGIGCKAHVRLVGTTDGIKAHDISLPTIPVGGSKDVELTLSSGMTTKDGSVDVVFYVEEPNGFGTDEMHLKVNTKAFIAPQLKIVDYAVTGESGSSLVKKEKFNLQFVLQNTQYGNAENVSVDVQFPEGVFVLDGQQSIAIPTLKAGETRSLEYQLIVNNTYTSQQIPVTIKLREKHGKYAENRTINLALNQTLDSKKISVNEIERKFDEIKIAQIGSDVDKNIPQVTVKNERTFALIIANENYQQVAKVPFARNDGKVFAEYCEKTLGMPHSNVHMVADATLNNIRTEVDWLKKIQQAYKGNARIVVYYAGHGIPDEQSRTAFLLPVDGNGNNAQTGYKLDDLYATLGNEPSQSVVVFLDACFSGSRREDGMLTQARGVAIKAKNGQPQGNMVVFSAAQGDETAYPNNEEGHGMFTYFLLKKLQETKGEVTLKELGDYIRTQVSQQSVVKNNKSQTPCVIPSTIVGQTWEHWTLK